MVTKVEFYKKSRFIFLSLIFSFLFISCFNSFTPNPDTLSQPSERYVDISGRYSIDGALPKAIVESMYPDMQNDFSRSVDGAGTLYSAFPIIGTTNNIVEYYAFAKDANGVEQNVTGSVTLADKSFQIPHLKIGVSWIVEVGIKVKNTVAGTDTWIRCLYDISEPKTFTETDFTFNKTFLLKPDTSGTGFVDLDMNLGASFDSSIVRLECELDDDTQCDKWNSATTEEFNFSKIKMSGLPAGVYDITLYFYTSLDGGYPAYTTVQSINVISGMTTETWCSDGTSLITGTGTNTAFNLTSALINEYKKSVIYVGQTSAATSVGITAHNDNEGTAYSPLASLQGAIDRITALNAGSKAYRILVSGLVTGNTQINVSNTCASSITIDNTGNQADAAAVLQSSSLASVLNITTNVPVTIRHVQINGGHAENGGGINIGNNAKVTLGNGTLIGGTTGIVPASGEAACANYAEHGGGIYSTGSLTLKSGAQIIYNYGTDGGGICCAGGSLTIEAGAKVNLNGSNTTAGGISITNTAFKMTGGEVCNNTSIHDIVGGLNIGGSCPDITISGATITGNSADAHGSAGGIYYAGGQTLFIGGNTIISGNHSAFEGGGIRVAVGTLELSNCTISGNYSANGTRAGGGVAANAGGYIKLSGSVYIPSGATINGEFKTGSGCNDVRQNYGPIIIKGPLTHVLTAQDDSIAILNDPMYANRNSVIIQADGTNVTDLTPYMDKFALVNSDWEAELSADKSKIYLNSPIYVKAGGNYVLDAENNVTTIGTKSDPFDSINHACAVMTNKDMDYEIYIDGEVTGSCCLDDNIKTDGSGTYNAKSILITGAHEIVPGNARTDILKQTDGNRVLLIKTEVPVTITNLKITGGNTTGFGGGIYLWPNTTLTLGDDALIEGNHAGRDGTSDAGGVYVKSGATFKITGNAVVFGNTAVTNTNTSNVYLDGSVITVAGPLVNSSDSTKKAKIGVSLPATSAPNLTTDVTFTSGYGYGSGGHNASVVPGTYFIGDKWGVRPGQGGTTGGTVGEACLAASGGSITLEPIYQALTLNVTKSVYLTSDSSKVITFTADNDLTIGSAEGNVSITSCVLTSHGETIPASSGDKTYYSTGTDTFTFESDLPTGDYSIDVTASYNGRSYSVRFPVQYKDQLGSKAKTQGKDVGDIVFNDGSTMSYTEYDSLPETIKNELKLKAIAVIFYKGTGLNSGNDTTTVRTLGLGLKQSLKAWCTDSANARSANITTIQCKKTSGTSGNLLFEDAEANDRNGSDNLEQIAAFLMRNELNPRNDTGVGINSSTTAEAAASLYPAFYFGKNYKNEKIGSETASRIISGSEFETGWYLPTIAELFQIDKNGKYDSTRIFDINAVLSALGGESFGNSYLSSSQDCGGAGNANKLLYDGVYNSGKNDGNMQVCCIREF